ncbi:MAG TPA: ferredoxin [Mycobacteriales bacterium]|nr:ferredoxin [Mycobacteriales bacterium]
MSEALRAHVDEQVCVGTGMCEATAPDLFEVGDDGTSHVLLEVVPPELVAAARKAAEDCPTRALSVSDG